MTRTKLSPALTRITLSALQDTARRANARAERALKEGRPAQAEGEVQRLERVVRMMGALAGQGTEAQR